MIEKDKLIELEGILRDIIGNANEAMPLGPFDQTDNCGENYQSEAFQRALDRGRNYLAAASLRARTA